MLTPSSADGKTSLARRVDTRSRREDGESRAEGQNPTAQMADGGLRHGAEQSVASAPAFAGGWTREHQALCPSPLCSRASRYFEKCMFSDGG